jgi:4-hydroxybenzoyl-CoA thioesterase
VETHARFLAPTRYGDDVVIETAVTAVRRASLQLHHHLRKDGALAVEGFETRVWVVRDSTQAVRYKPKAIPPDIVARLSDPIGPT